MDSKILAVPVGRNSAEFPVRLDTGISTVEHTQRWHKEVERGMTQRSCLGHEVPTYQRTSDRTGKMIWTIALFEV